MRRTPAVLASLLLMGAFLPAAPRADAASTPDPTPRPPSVERLLVAVPDPGASVPQDLPARLHLADPRAAIVVVLAGEAPRTIGSFRVAVDDEAIRIGAVEVPLPAVPLPAASPDAHVTVVEVLGDASGVIAHRAGDLLPSPDEIRLPAWRLPGPGAAAVALDGSWWELASSVVEALADAETAAAADPAEPSRLAALLRRVARHPVSDLRRVVAADLGDVTGDGRPDLALSFRRPFRRTLLNASLPRATMTDPHGLSAHVGLFDPRDLSARWVAGTLLRPVAALAACDHALAVATSALDDPRVTATAVWPWEGFGFRQLPELPGPGRPTCIDIDRDGRLDATIVERSQA